MTRLPNDPSMSPLPPHSIVAALVLSCSNIQATVAQSLVAAQEPIISACSQVVTSSIKLTAGINGATIGLALTFKGAQGVLDASGLSPADVGLNAPLVASGPAAPSASPSPNQ